MQTAPSLMAPITVNHIGALNPTARPSSTVNKMSSVRFWVQIPHNYFFFCIYCRNTWSCTEGPTSSPNTKKAERERVTFLFDLFKDQVKVCFPFDSQINDYAIHVYPHVQLSEDKTHPKLLTFCCSSSAARIKYRQNSWTRTEKCYSIFCWSMKSTKLINIYRSTVTTTKGTSEIIDAKKH